MQLSQDALERREGQLTLGRRPGEEEKRQVGVAIALCAAGRVEVPRRVPLVAGHEGDLRAAFGKCLSARNGHRLVAHVVGVLADIADHEHARRAGMSRMSVLRHGLAALPVRRCGTQAPREGAGRGTQSAQGAASPRPVGGESGLQLALARIHSGLTSLNAL